MHVLSLHNTLAIDGASGGKGRQLALLLAEGLPVPAGFVVRSTAFDKFVDGSGVREDLAILTQDEKVLDPSMLTRYAAEFTLRMNAIPFPEELSQEINTALGTPTPHTFAVRSSAGVEDGARSAWAGQFETLLSVPQSEAANAVRSVWTSLCSPRALAALRGARVAEFRMAIVIQTMILPRVSGVLFTVDPVNLRHDNMIIEAIAGHNRTLVDGSVTPDHYVLSRGDLSVLTQDAVHHEKPVLSKSELRSLGAAGLRIEKILGTPADIEWAYDGEALTILQARPVTGRTCA